MTVVVEVKGTALEEEWLDAKEMCSGGCQSFVATRRTKEGEERRVLIRGVMDRPAVTARVPF